MRSRWLLLALITLALLAFSLAIPALTNSNAAAAGVALAALLLGHALVLRSIYLRGWKSILARGFRRPAIWLAVALHVVWVLTADAFFSKIACSLHSAILVKVGYGLFDYWPMAFIIASLTWIELLPVYFVSGALGVVSGIAYGLVLEGFGWLSSRRIWAWVIIGVLLFLVSSFFLTAAAILLSISMGWGYHV